MVLNRISVKGSFWHLHACCMVGQIPRDAGGPGILVGRDTLHLQGCLCCVHVRCFKVDATASEYQVCCFIPHLEVLDFLT